MGTVPEGYAGIILHIHSTTPHAEAMSNSSPQSRLEKEDSRTRSMVTVMIGRNALKSVLHWAEDPQDTLKMS